MKKDNYVGTHGSCVRSGLPDRKPVRASFHDYSGGDYFVTICTEGRCHFFGEISDGEMCLSEIGRYCKQQLSDLSAHYPYASVPLYVVMPNHIHAIISIDAGRTNDTCEPTQSSGRTHEPCVPTVRSILSVVVGGLKRAVTMFARRNNIEFGWQSRFHDHVIRGTVDGNKINDYIENNVARWAYDCYY